MNGVRLAWHGEARELQPKSALANFGCVLFFGQDTMKIMLCLVGLTFAYRLASGEQSQQPLADEDSTGGLADLALRPADLGDRWVRRIELLFDPQATPSEIFQLGTNSPRRRSADSEVQATISKRKEEKRRFFSSSLEMIQAEAQIMLEYRDSDKKRDFSMTIYRFKSMQAADAQLKIRRGSDAFRIATVGGAEVIYTKAGQGFPGGVVASNPSVELRQGPYIIMVAPAIPNQDDPGFGLAQQQVQKAKSRAEPPDSSHPAQLKVATARTTNPPGSLQRASKIIPAGGIKFFSIELSQLLPFYAEYAGAQLDTSELGKLQPLQISFENKKDVTRSEIVQLLDKALYDQIGIVVSHPDSKHAVFRFRSTQDKK